MERAIFLTNTSQLKYVNSKHSRIYYGNEFCERLIPAPEQVCQILSYAKKNKLRFSLVTPYVTHIGFGKLNSLFKLLEDSSAACEVIINDWGILNLVRHKYLNFIPVLGRLLTKQKRDPHLINLLKRETRLRFVKNPKNLGIKHLIFQKKLPEDLDPYYKGSNISSVPIIHNFLIRQRIKRIELDNTTQGLFLNLPKGRISASLYVPYGYITTTFFCPTAGCEKKRKSLLKIQPCKKECQKYIFKLRNPAMHKVIYLKGNTQFYKNVKYQLKEWERLGVDRIVYEPEIPI